MATLIMLVAVPFFLLFLAAMVVLWVWLAKLLWRWSMHVFRKEN